MKFVCFGFEIGYGSPLRRNMYRFAIIRSLNLRDYSIINDALLRSIFCGLVAIFESMSRDTLFKKLIILNRVVAQSRV